MTSPLDPEGQRFRLNPRYRLQWEDAQQCNVLLYPEGLIKLNDTAAEILRHCLEPINREELVATLQQEYPEAETLAEDVAEFLKHAQQEEWILRAEV